MFNPFQRLRQLCGLLTLLSCAACFDASTEQGGARTVETASPVTITALVWAPDWPQEMNRIADEFMQANPDVLVEVQFMIGNSVEENIKPKLAANHLPDLVSINPNAYGAQLADQGWLVDLQETPAWRNMLDSLKPEWISQGGRHYGIAGGVAATLIYYNESMFAKAGISRMPADFDEFLALCAALRKAGFVPMMWNGGFPNMIGNGPFSAGFAQQIVAHHPDWKEGIASGRLDLATAETAAIFSRIRALPEKGYVQKDYLQTGYDDGIELFRNGQTAMAFQGTWAAGLLMHATGFTTGVMAPPWNAKGQPQVPVLGSETGFAVCATANRKAALRFLDFIYGKGLSIQQNKRQNLPPLKVVPGPLVSDRKITDYVRAASNAPLHGGLYYAFLPANSIEMLHPLMQEVMAGSVTPLAAARALDRSIKAEVRGCSQ